jgi:hypothetical protein
LGIEVKKTANAPIRGKTEGIPKKVPIFIKNRPKKECQTKSDLRHEFRQKKENFA